MGNCCGLFGDGPDLGPGHTLGTASPHQTFGMANDANEREKRLQAAEERHRQNAVRGTQRTTPKKTPNYNKPSTLYTNTTGATTDISDWS